MQESPIQVKTYEITEGPGDRENQITGCVTYLGRFSAQTLFYLTAIQHPV